MSKVNIDSGDIQLQISLLITPIIATDKKVFKKIKKLINLISNDLTNNQFKGIQYYA